MFTDYHLEKLIQAINDAEERQTKAIVAAINGMKENAIVDHTPEKKIEIEVHPDLFPDEIRESMAKATTPAKKPATTKKPTVPKKAAPVRSRN